MTNDTDKSLPQFGTCAVPRWSDSQSRKDNRRLVSLLKEFSTIMAGAQAKLEEHVLPEYEERLRQIHQSNLAAVERVQVLADMAANGGVVLVPQGWIKESDNA